ncbi:Probable protein phosphatase 2C 65 [Striga hermonthica]|uniref:Probable protein phosphatase 2C 65 n=1 Tax=Striga hermonthica TaxID=68872 RepID=A0A9N7NGW0_STRHE|nr:Probable protein phosphatase 2C 65 [Striga hermonthica]
MGACCSCHRGGSFVSYYAEEVEERRAREYDDGDDDIILKGDSGARIRLQGSSKQVSMFSQQGKKGINQDAMTVWESFSGDKDMYLCAVFDGHGPSGHKVARYVRDSLPSKISKLYRQPCVDIDIETETGQESPESKNPLLLSWKARLTKCFHEIDEQLEGDASVESYSSGTTSVCILRKGEHLIIANLGDSRAVLGKRDESNQLVSEQLTVDLKPNLPREAERIRSCEGRVLAMDEEPNVYRVWMPHDDCPGLAMARAFGDFCLKDFGLISTPEVTYRKLTERDEFVILATDGIWDALSNEEVVQIVGSSRRRSIAAKLLVEQARWAWRYKFPRSKIDDCAVVCLFFKNQRASLTKSVSEKTHLSLNYADLDVRSYAGSMQSDDALDTVLNCKVDEESPAREGPDEKGSSDLVRLRRRREERRRKLECIGE